MELISIEYKTDPAEIADNVMHHVGAMLEKIADRAYMSGEHATVVVSNEGITVTTEERDETTVRAAADAKVAKAVVGLVTSGQLGVRVEPKWQPDYLTADELRATGSTEDPEITGAARRAAREVEAKQT